MFTMNARNYNEQTMKGLFRKVYPLIAGQMIARTGIRRGVCIDLGGGPGMLMKVEPLVKAWCATG